MGSEYALATDAETKRLTMLALLLENVGIDKAVRLGDPAIWRAAVAELLQKQDDSAYMLHEAE